MFFFWIPSLMNTYPRENPLPLKSSNFVYSYSFFFSCGKPPPSVYSFSFLEDTYNHLFIISDPGATCIPRMAYSLVRLEAEMGVFHQVALTETIWFNKRDIFRHLQFQERLDGSPILWRQLFSGLPFDRPCLFLCECCHGDLLTPSPRQASFICFWGIGWPRLFFACLQSVVLGYLGELLHIPTCTNLILHQHITNKPISTTILHSKEIFPIQRLTSILIKTTFCFFSLGPPWLRHAFSSLFFGPSPPSEKWFGGIGCAVWKS